MRKSTFEIIVSEPKKRKSPLKFIISMASTVLFCAYVFFNVASLTATPVAVKICVCCMITALLAYNIITCCKRIKEIKAYNRELDDAPKAPPAQKLAEEPKPTETRPTPAATISPADELKKYKELLDMGAITEEEYEAKKNQLLEL